MKRLRPRCFKEIFEREEAEFGLEIDYALVERLRRLIWCYNKYIFPTTTPELLFRLAKYHNLIKFARPNVWLPRIRTGQNKKRKNSLKLQFKSYN